MTTVGVVVTTGGRERVKCLKNQVAYQMLQVAVKSVEISQNILACL